MRPDNRIGRVVADRYRLDSILGMGGMGVVYAGTHTWTDRPVAVKILLAEFADQSEHLKRFFQEAKAAASLRHPNVVDVLDMGEDDDGSAFIVMEQLGGESLSERLGREGRLSAAAVLKALLPIMEALQLAHDRGIIHRDIKPDNIYLTPAYGGREVPKLLDFGVAKSATAVFSTQTGSMLGTPMFMSPEQMRSVTDLTPASDVWSMGVVWFMTLSGRLPVEVDPNPAKMLISLAQGDRPKLGSVAQDVPARIGAAVDGALMRDLTSRHTSMNDFIDALLAAAKEDSIEARDPRRRGD